MAFRLPRTVVRLKTCVTVHDVVYRDNATKRRNRKSPCQAATELGGG